MGKLDGKVAVITGAASGMGRAMSIRFAREGAAIVLADLNAAGADEVVSEIKRGGGRASFRKTDVSREDDIRSAIDTAVREFGSLNIMINNAGIGGATGALEAVTAEHWDKTFAVLIRAVFLGIKYAVPPMRQAGGGAIVSTSSVAGLRGVGYLACYSAAKAAVINLTESAAIEFGRQNIRVNCICPGGVNTPLVYRGVPGGYEANEQRMAKMQPIPRAGRPEDIAAMALFLCSDDAEWISGTHMVVDGGLATGNARSAIRGPSGASFSGPSFERPER